MKQLTRFSVRAEERSFIISLEDDEGGAIELEASPEQLDAVIDALDELIAEDEDDESLQNPTGAAYQKPLG